MFRNEIRRRAFAPVATRATRATRTAAAALACCAALLSVLLPAQAALAATPAAQQPLRTAAFFSPVWALEAPAAGAQAELQAVLDRYSQQPPSPARSRWADTTVLDAYLRDHTASPWRASLWANMGWRAQADGYTRVALQDLAQSQEASRNVDWSRVPAYARQQLDDAVATRISLTTGLGHIQQAQALFADPRVAQLAWPAAGVAYRARVALAAEQDDPAANLRCGWVALGHLLQAQGAPESTVAALRTEPAGPHGTSLAQLSQWSNAHGLALQAVTVAAGQSVPVPSVVHYRTAHFAAIVGERQTDGVRYLDVLDPVVGHRAWLSADAVAAESSGHFLVSRGQATHYAALAPDAARQVIGAGNPGTKTTNATGANEPTATDGTVCGCGANGFAPNPGTGSVSNAPAADGVGGMMTYAVQSLLVSLSRNSLKGARVHDFSL
jgi:hypothetical protein